MNMIQLLLLTSLTLYSSYSLSKTIADADWALFNLANFTGSWYGRDYADCKTPGIHLYYWLIGKIAGRSIERVKFIDHMLTAAPGLAYYAATGNFIPSLIYVVLVNSPHFQSFTGNVGHLAAWLLMATLIIQNPIVASLLLMAVIFIEPKLLPAGMAMIISNKWWQTLPWLFTGLIVAAGIIYLISRKSDHSFKEIYGWIIESSVTIPKRMSQYRASLFIFMPWWTSELMVWILPWAITAGMARPELTYWIPAILYFITISMGFTIRPYHLLPLLPWIALAGIPATTAYILIAIELFTCGFYLGDIWTRHYRYHGDMVKGAAGVGLWLKDKPGTIWVNGMHTQVYIYAQKPVPYGLAEQIEINDVAKERRAKMIPAFKQHPADWVIITDNQKMPFAVNGYRQELEAPGCAIYKKVL